MGGRGWIIASVVCAIVLRILYAFHSPYYMTTGDSVSYYLTASNIQKTSTVFDPWRVPVYPLIIALPYAFGGKDMPEFIQGVYQSELFVVRLWQSAAVVFSGALICALSLSLGIPGWMSMLVSLLTTSDSMLLLLEHAILTEAFALFWVVLLSWVMYALLKTLNIKYVCLMVLLWIFGVMLRPGLIGIPVLCSVVLCLRWRNIQVYLSMVASILIYAAVLIGYAQGNLATHGYRGISRVSDVNIWGVVLRLGKKDLVYPQTDIGRMAQSVYQGDSRDPWEIFRTYPKLFDSTFAEAFGDFAKNMRERYGISYIVQSIQHIPHVVVAKTDVIDVGATTGLFDRTFVVLGFVYRYLMYAMYWSLLSALLFLYMAIFRPSTLGTMGLFLSLLGWYQVLLTAGFTYDDYGRHMIIVRGMMYVVLCILFVLWRSRRI
jgi:hypothetical protein